MLTLRSTKTSAQFPRFLPWNAGNPSSLAVLSEAESGLANQRTHGNPSSPPYPVIPPMKPLFLGAVALWLVIGVINALVWYSISRQYIKGGFLRNTFSILGYLTSGPIVGWTYFADDLTDRVRKLQLEAEATRKAESIVASMGGPYGIINALKGGMSFDDLIAKANPTNNPHLN